MKTIITDTGTGITDEPSPQARWNRANKKAYWAHRALRSAIRAGLLVRQPFEEGGDAGTVDGHHDDYDRRTKVQWLCHKHHRRWPSQ